MSLSAFFQQYEYITAGFILLLFYGIAQLIHFITKNTLQRWALKTKTSFDDELIAAAQRPLYVAILLTGIQLATQRLSAVQHIQPGFGRLLIAIWILLGAYTIVKGIHHLLRAYMRDTAHREHREFRDKHAFIFGRLFHIIIYIIAFIMVLRNYGVEITPLITSLGIGGLVIGLALQESLSNFFSGFYLVSEGSLNIGDYIELENGLKGYVEEIDWRVTKIRTYYNNYVIVPNSKLAQNITTNYEYPNEELGVSLDVSITYDSNLKKAEKIALKVAKKVQDTYEHELHYEPYLLFREFGESSINFTIFLRVVKYNDQYEMKHALIKELKNAFDKAKIEFAFPTRTIHMRK